MKLKTTEIDGKQYAEVSDGKPVYVSDDGKEHVYDAAAMRGSLDRLNSALTEERKAKEAAEKAAEAFKGIDPTKAAEALATVKNLDDKKLIDAGEVERIKQETAQGWQKRLDEAQADAEKLREQFAAEKLNAAFAGSKFVNDKLSIPPDMVQAAFARHFQFKDGRINPVDQNGNPIYSAANPGDVASFDEALEIVVSTYPHRDSILKGNGQSGSGAGPVGNGAKRNITRSQFNEMRPEEQSKMAQAARKGEIQITD